MLNQVKAIYELMPDSVKRVTAMMPPSFKFGLSYRRWRRKIRETEVFDAEALQKSQSQWLRKIAIHAYTTTIFWRQYFDKHRFDPYRADWDSLEKLPPIDSDTVKENFDKMISSVYRLRGYVTSTGGSGRRPTPLFLSNESYGIEWAFITRIWEEAGFRWGCKRVTFRGQDLGDCLVRENPVYNELNVNVFRLARKTFPTILRAIRAFKPSYVHGYTSTILKFIALAKEAGEDLRSLSIKGCLLGSEGCTDEQRELIKEAFNTKIITWYGQSEKVILAGECSGNCELHSFPQYGVLEILNESGMRSKKGEIVGTSLVNYAMPLLRYRTGDYGELAEGRECSCGLHYTRLKSVVGRWGKDFLVSYDGTRVTTTALNLHGPAQTKILEYQLWQKIPGIVEARIVPQECFDDSTSREVANQLRRKLGDGFSVKISIVEPSKIYRTHRGKVPMLVQDIKSKTK